MGGFLAWRTVASLGLALVIGVSGLARWPLTTENVFLAMVASERPRLWQALGLTYAALWFSTPFIALSVLSSLLYIFATRAPRGAFKPLPPYPAPASRDELFLVLGEQHLQRTPQRAQTPRWLTLPERGLYTGLAIVGAIGTGKTSGCMYPYAEQLLAYRAADPDRKLAGLVLEVKGDFCHQVRAMLARHGRGDDYVEVGLDSPWCYNPLHNDLEAYALAYGIASLLTNLYGRGKEPFWQQAYTNLVKFVILLYKTLDDYVTLFQVYEACINPDVLRARIAEGETRFAAGRREVVISAGTYLAYPALRAWPFTEGESAGHVMAPWHEALANHLTQHAIAHDVREAGASSRETLNAEQFAAVKRWFEHDWMRIEPKLRTSIVEGISVFLSLFDDNPAVKRTFCPPKACYDPVENADGRLGRPLPPLGELIEQGKVIALNFPIAANPGLARALGVLLKQDFQRAVLTRIPSIASSPHSVWRQVLFLCDEYQSFATVGEADPSGDEKFFALSRQARCIPIVATQSLSSLRSTLAGESWRTLLQCFRTKIFLALSDDFSARVASELCGKIERLKPSYALTEAGQQARVSLFTGRAASPTSTLTAAKTYTTSLDFVFQPKVFAELQNAQAIVLPYDGLNPWPPTYSYLKPHWLDPQVSYFDHLAEGRL